MKTPAALQLTVKATRNMLGKLSGGYVAAMLGVEQRAETKEAAVERLAEMLDNTMRHAYARRYLVTPKGTVFALYHVPGGWAYDIVHAASVQGAVSPGSSMMGESFINAYDAMKRHYEQMQADELLA